MAEASYESIAPLVTRVRELKDSVQCTFTCPVSGAAVEAEGPLVEGRELADVSSADASLLGSLRNTLGSMLRRALGGKSQPDATPVETPDGAPSRFSESERKAGILLAFRSVSNQFIQDPETDRWLAVESASELFSRFDRQLEMAPIQESKDREVASRILVELARADGQVTRTEWAFLAEFIPGDISSVDTFMEKPAIRAKELNASTKGAVRDTMLMLAWALAHVDDVVDQEEVDQILTWAKGLRIPKSQALELRRHAQLHLLDQAFRLAYPKARLDAKRRAEALTLGDQLGLVREDVLEAEERFKKRMGVKP